MIPGNRHKATQWPVYVARSIAQRSGTSPVTEFPCKSRRGGLDNGDEGYFVVTPIETTASTGLGRERAVAGSEKAKAKKEQLKGKAKETAGRTIGNEEMTAKGRAEKAKGDARQAKEKGKDIFRG